jgi:hypothetical protein
MKEFTSRTEPLLRNLTNRCRCRARSASVSFLWLSAFASSASTAVTTIAEERGLPVPHVISTRPAALRGIGVPRGVERNNRHTEPGLKAPAVTVVTLSGLRGGDEPAPPPRSSSRVPSAHCSGGQLAVRFAAVNGVQQAECSRCGEVKPAPIASSKGGGPPPVVCFDCQDAERIRQALQSRGWTVSGPERGTGGFWRAAAGKPVPGQTTGSGPTGDGRSPLQAMQSLEANIIAAAGQRPDI